AGKDPKRHERYRGGKPHDDLCNPRVLASRAAPGIGQGPLFFSALGPSIICHLPPDSTFSSNKVYKPALGVASICCYSFVLFVSPLAQAGSHEPPKTKSFHVRLLARDSQRGNGHRSMSVRKHRPGTDVARAEQLIVIRDRLAVAARQSDRDADADVARTR